jgi:hypothetical protein
MCERTATVKMNESAVTGSVKDPVPNLHRPPSICLKYQFRCLFCRHRRALQGKLCGWSRPWTLLIAKAMAPFGPLKTAAFPVRPFLEPSSISTTTASPISSSPTLLTIIAAQKSMTGLKRSLPLTSNAWRSRMLTSGRKSPFLRSENVAHLLRRGFPRCSAQYCM